MKTIIIGLLSICMAVAVQAQQIKITAGTFVKTGSQQQLVLSNGMHFENNADLQLAQLQLQVSGVADNRLSGTGTLVLGGIRINKQAGGKLIMEKDISITGEVDFKEGFLDLNGRTLNLHLNAMLKNEQATSRITGHNGGTIEISTDLRQPSNLNPGNLGLIISSPAAPGWTVIRRRHQPFNNGGGSSISRSFDIIPANNTGLNATLTMQYFDEELNGLNESQLVVYQSPNNGNSWYVRGFSNRDNTMNLVTATNITSFNTFTLSTINNALPIRLSSLSLQCDNDQPTIKWKTVNPQDVLFFQIEKSFNGQDWEPVAGNILPQTSPQHEYRFTDNQLPGKSYRIKSIEQNNEISYSALLQADCKGKGNAFALLGNPVKQELQLSITATEAKQLGIQVIDPQGRIWHKQTLQISGGHTIRSISLPAGAKGLYHLRIIENGKTVWTKTFLKM